MAWSLAITSYLRHEMALHARCDACSVLIGPGHVDGRIDRLCGTHAGRRVSGPALPIDPATDSLDWIAGQATH